jgi:hypothetical protein
VSGIVLRWAPPAVVAAAILGVPGDSQEALWYVRIPLQVVLGAALARALGGGGAAVSWASLAGAAVALVDGLERSGFPAHRPKLFLLFASAVATLAGALAWATIARRRQPPASSAGAE